MQLKIIRSVVECRNMNIKMKRVESERKVEREMERGRVRAADGRTEIKKEAENHRDTDKEKIDRGRKS